jgi:hypothetical protein
MREIREKQITTKNQAKKIEETEKLIENAKASALDGTIAN